MTECRIADGSIHHQLVTLLSHPSALTTETFGSFSFNQSEDSILYSAEAYTNSNSDDDSDDESDEKTQTSTTASSPFHQQQFQFVAPLGEKFQQRTRPCVFLFNFRKSTLLAAKETEPETETETETVSKTLSKTVSKTVSSNSNSTPNGHLEFTPSLIQLVAPSESFYLGQAIFSPDGKHIILTGYRELKDARRLGIIYCTNRPASIYSLPLPLPVQPKIKHKTFQRIKVQEKSFRKLSPENVSARSPRIYVKNSNSHRSSSNPDPNSNSNSDSDSSSSCGILIFIGNEEGGAHNDCASIYSLELSSSDSFSDPITSTSTSTSTSISESISESESVKTLLPIYHEPDSTGFAGAYLDQLPAEPFMSDRSGRQILFNTICGSRRIPVLLNIESGKIRTLAPRKGISKSPSKSPDSNSNSNSSSSSSSNSNSNSNSNPNPFSGSSDSKLEPEPVPVAVAPSGIPTEPSIPTWSYNALSISSDGLVLASRSAPLIPPQLVLTKASILNETDERWHVIWRADEDFQRDADAAPDPEGDVDAEGKGKGEDEIAEILSKLKKMKSSIISDIPGTAPLTEAIMLWSSSSGTFQKSKSILFPHGGPHGTTEYSWSPSNAAFALAGYNLIMPNYSGSLGLGQDFAHSLIGKVGSLDVKDCLACINHLVKLGLADENKLSVMGGSHGGFIAAHLVGQYPNVFKSVAMRNPVIANGEMAATSDIRDWCFSEFGENFSFSDPPSTLSSDFISRTQSLSPISHVRKISTPVLILLGLCDQRVPPQQGRLLYHALRNQDKKVRMLAFENADHALETVQAEWNGFQAILEWFEEALKIKELKN